MAQHPPVQTDRDYAPFLTLETAVTYAESWARRDGRRRHVSLRRHVVGWPFPSLKRWTVTPGVPRS